MSKVDLFFYPKNNGDVFSNISRATIHQMEKDREISQKLLEARNRVDISLTEYEALKDRINKAETRANEAESQVRFFKSILTKLKLPLDDENFKPYEIQTEWLKEPMSRCRKFIVRFKVMENFDL